MDNIEFPDKYYKLKDVREQLTSDCDLCNHTGFVDGKYCKCFKKFERYVGYAYSGIDEEYWEVTFNNFKSDQVAREEAEKYSQHLSNARKNGLGIIFHGDNGTGKSMLASIILMNAKKLKYTVYFITFAELLELVKKSFDNEYYKHFYETKVKNADFLCLDELGAEYRPKDIESFCVSQLSSLSRYRRRNNLCTIVTTNLEKSAFTNTYGKTINSLFSGCSKFVSVVGPDWRNSQNKNWDKNLSNGK